MTMSVSEWLYAVGLASLVAFLIGVGAFGLMFW